MDAAAAAGGLGLQRSEISFRRTGSSGLVWDDKFLGELAKVKPASSSSQDDADPPRASSSDPSSTGAAKEVLEKQAYKTMKVPSPSVDPPSPKVSGCAGICSAFGKQDKTARGGGKSKRAAAAAKVGRRRV